MIERQAIYELTHVVGRGCVSPFKVGDVVDVSLPREMYIPDSYILDRVDLPVRTVIEGSNDVVAGQHVVDLARSVPGPPEWELVHSPCVGAMRLVVRALRDGPVWPNAKVWARTTYLDGRERADAKVDQLIRGSVEHDKAVQFRSPERGPFKGAQAIKVGETVVDLSGKIEP